MEVKLGTVETRRTAEACVFEGGVVAMAAYDNQHGGTVYKVCLTEGEVSDLQASPYVNPDSIVWHYRDGKWLIPPEDGEDGQSLAEYGLITAIIAVAAILALTLVGVGVGYAESIYHFVT
jgi:hypothetical protein